MKDSSKININAELGPTEALEEEKEMYSSSGIILLLSL